MVIAMDRLLPPLLPFFSLPLPAPTSPMTNDLYLGDGLSGRAYATVCPHVSMCGCTARVSPKLLGSLCHRGACAWCFLSACVYVGQRVYLCLIGFAQLMHVWLRACACRCLFGCGICCRPAACIKKRHSVLGARATLIYRPTLVWIGTGSSRVFSFSIERRSVHAERGACAQCVGRVVAVSRATPYSIPSVDSQRGF